MIEGVPLKIRKGASLNKNPIAAAEELHHVIMQPDISLTLFYCSPEYNLPVLGKALKELSITHKSLCH
ncbi:MAG: hypothetical protein U1F42_07995 [Candidatus Competibacteraceae bacterium]